MALCFKASRRASPVAPSWFVLVRSSVSRGSWIMRICTSLEKPPEASTMPFAVLTKVLSPLDSMLRAKPSLSSAPMMRPDSSSIRRSSFVRSSTGQPSSSTLATCALMISAPVALEVVLVRGTEWPP